jgi:hypothetical protein
MAKLLRAYLSHYIENPLKMLGKTLIVLWSVLRGTACQFSIEFWLKFQKVTSNIELLESTHNQTNDRADSQLYPPK